ncbi:MAG: VanZ family protein [Spirochaetales bacterium]|nr:VanZ family protein [Spirochaetales bacterium]
MLLLHLYELKRYRIIPYILLAIVLGGMLFFGLRQKGDDPTNNLSWEAEGGLKFTSPSLAYTETGFKLPQYDEIASIDLTISPKDISSSALQIILMIYNETKDEQFVIGLRGENIVVLQGNDYDKNNGSNQLIAHMGITDSKEQIHIETGKNGTIISLNGKIIAEKKQLNLMLPTNNESSRLILGSNIKSQYGWNGIIYDLKLTSINNYSITYNFCCPPTELIHETNGQTPALYLPGERPILENNFLRLPKFNETALLELISDIFINLLGFIPLGSILYLMIGRNRKKGNLIVMGLIILYSLYFETVQVWLPTRNSSLLDLIMNCVGGYIGIIIATKYGNLIKKIKRNVPDTC